MDLFHIFNLHRDLEALCICSIFYGFILDYYSIQQTIPDKI